MPSKHLAEHMAAGAKAFYGRHADVMAHFEDFLVSRQFEPASLAEICSAIGVSERTLRTCCQEQVGMGPARYRRLRRMHLARCALLRADPTISTVTTIATDHGFWELGRFSVEYRALFGESPSASLRRMPTADFGTGSFGFRRDAVGIDEILCGPTSAPAPGSDARRDVA